MSHSMNSQENGSRIDLPVDDLKRLIQLRLQLLIYKMSADSAIPSKTTEYVALKRVYCQFILETLLEYNYANSLLTSADFIDLQKAEDDDSRRIKYVPEIFSQAFVEIKNVTLQGRSPGVQLPSVDGEPL